MAKRKNRTLITGGGGFVGRHLVDAACARGDKVTVLEFNGEAHRDDVNWINADVRDEEAVRKAIKGQDTVFHNASIVHTRRDHEHIVWSVNLDGSRHVLKACQDFGVKKLVYVSSASAVYEGKDIENGDETMAYSAISQAPYSDSKIAAEKLILAANGENGVATAAVRPHVIFGPGDTRFLPAILARAEAGKLRFKVGWKEKLSDFTYIDNLIDGLMKCEAALTLDSPVAGEAYFVTNGEPRRFFDFVEEVLRQLDLPKIIGAVPFPVAYTVAAVAEAVDRLRGGKLDAENGMSRFAVRYMCTHHYFSVAKAKRDFGYVPTVDLDEAIVRTVAWLRENRGSTGAAAA